VSWRRAGSAWLAAALLAGAVQAHTRSVSYSSWTLDPEGANVHVRVSILELTRLAIDPTRDVGSGGAVGRYLAEHLSLERGGVRCETLLEPVAETAPKGFVHFRWRLRCPAQGAARIESRILLAQAPSHLHFARVAREAGALERVLTEAAPFFSLPDPASGEAATAHPAQGTGLGGYVALGVEHILTGWDHLAFVLALLLLARRAGEVAALVTAFTLAHSITLGLAVLGVLRPDGAAVEALIGYSIAMVAAENGWLLSGRGVAVPGIATAGLGVLGALALAGIGSVPAPALLGLALFSLCHFGLLQRSERPARLRAAVAFAFGLVHGFGFAGVLGEMQLPPQRLVPALFGFNLGVEIGQLAVVALVWPALGALERRAPEGLHRRVAEAGSAAICGLGLYWFVARTLG
jgi:hypothetical protein